MIGTVKWIVILLCIALFAACGDSGNREVEPPPAKDLVWNEDNWDEREWQ